MFIESILLLNEEVYTSFCQMSFPERIPTSSLFFFLKKERNAGLPIFIFLLDMIHVQTDISFIFRLKYIQHSVIFAC